MADLTCRIANSTRRKSCVVLLALLAMISIFDQNTKPTQIMMALELTRDFGSIGAQVVSLELSPDEQLLAVASCNAYIVCDYDAYSGKKKWSSSLKWTSYAAVFSPDFTHFAVTDLNRNVATFASETGALLRTLTGHRYAITDLAWSSTGIVASASKDKTVRLWNPDDGTCLQTLSGHSNFVLTVAFSPDGTRLASGSLDTTVRIWDVESGTCLHTLTGHTDEVVRVAFSPDGSKLASTSHDGTIHIWSSSSDFNCIRSLAGAGVGDPTIAWSPDSRILASANGTSLQLWNESGEPVFEMPSKVCAVAFSRFSHDIITADSDGRICEWRSPVTWALETMRFGEVSPPSKSSHDVSGALERIYTIIDRVELPTAFHHQISCLHVLHDHIGSEKELNPDLAVRIEECFGNLINHQQTLRVSHESLQNKAQQHLPVSDAKDDLVALDSSKQHISQAIQLLEKLLQLHAAMPSSSKRNDRPPPRKPTQDDLNEILRFASTSSRRIAWLENTVVETARSFEIALLRYDQYSAEIREQSEKNLDILDAYLAFLTLPSISSDRIQEIESTLSKLQAKFDSENKIMTEIDQSLSVLSAFDSMNKLFQAGQGEEQKAKADIKSSAHNESSADFKTHDDGQGRQQSSSPDVDSADYLHQELEQAKANLKSTSGISHNPHLVYKWLTENPESELDAGEVFDIIGFR